MPKNDEKKEFTAEGKKNLLMVRRGRDAGGQGHEKGQSTSWA